MTIKQEQGVTAVEYGLIAGLISIVIITAVAITGINTKRVFCVIATELSKTLSLSDDGYCSGSGSSTDGNGTSGGNTAGDNTDNSSKTSASIDPNYVDTSLGGNATPDTDSTVYDAPYNEALSETLASLNSSDPITSVYGIYDNNNKPLTSYSDIQNGLNTNGGTTIMGSTTASTLEDAPYVTQEAADVNGETPTSTASWNQVYQQDVAQVKTNSGNVYTVATEYYYNSNTGNSSVLTYTIDSNNNIGNIVEKDNNPDII